MVKLKKYDGKENYMDVRKENSLTEKGVQVGTGYGTSLTSTL